MTSVNERMEILLVGIRALCGFGISISLFSICLQVKAASFDCDRASTKVEYLICSTATLSDLDGKLGLAYKKALSIWPDVKEQQKSWLKGRSSCKAVECLINYYKDRLGQFNSLTTGVRYFSSFDETIPWDFIPPVDMSLRNAVTKNGQLIGFELENIHRGMGFAIYLLKSNSVVEFEALKDLLAFEKKLGLIGGMGQYSQERFELHGDVFNVSQDFRGDSLLNAEYRISGPGIKNGLEFSIFYAQDGNSIIKNYHYATGNSLFYPMGDGTYFIVMHGDGNGNLGIAIRVAQDLATKSDMVGRKIFFMAYSDLQNVVGNLDQSSDEQGDLDEKAQRKLTNYMLRSASVFQSTK